VPFFGPCKNKHATEYISIELAAAEEKLQLTEPPAFFEAVTLKMDLFLFHVCIACG